MPHRGGTKSEVAHKWGDWLDHPCRPGGPQCLRAGNKIRSGSQMGRLSRSPHPSMGSPTPQSGGQNQMWPINGQIGYVTPAVSGVPNTSATSDFVVRFETLWAP